MQDPLPNTNILKLKQDQKLVKRILASDERALKQFFDEYFPRLYRYASYRMNNDSDVEEVVQTVLTIAARRMETYRGEASLLTWMMQICRREISRQLKKSSHHADLMVPFLNDDLLRSIVESMEADETDNPEETHRRHELITLVQFVLDQLPEHYAQALELKYIEGFDSKEIALRLKNSDEAIQSLLARARRAFKEVSGEALHAFLSAEQKTTTN